MINLFSCNYLNRKPIENAMKNFAKNFSKNQKILDIGCGNKPYEKFFKCKYLGLDPFKKTKADIIANAWEIPCKDNEFDGMILNQALEHIEKTKETISEIKRVLKPSGLCIVTAPQTMKNHSVPIPSKNVAFDNFNKNKIKYFNVDYYRFTKFGLIVLFKDFEIISIKQNTYYFGTIFQLINYFFASFGLGKLFIPIYFINNLLGKISDNLSLAITSLPFSFMKKIKLFILESLTIDNIMLIKKK